MIAVIQEKSNEVRWRDKRHDHCGCAIERRAVSDEESKKADPQKIDRQSQKKNRRAMILNTNKSSKTK
jgi:hypothetical protein